MEVIDLAVLHSPFAAAGDAGAATGDPFVEHRLRTEHAVSFAVQSEAATLWVLFLLDPVGVAGSWEWLVLLDPVGVAGDSRWKYPRPPVNPPAQIGVRPDRDNCPNRNRCPATWVS